MRQSIKFIISFFLLVGFLGVGTKSVLAQAAPKVNYECVGQVLAEYMNTVIAGKQGLDKIQLLSPVFNITASDGSTATIVSSMVANGAQFGSLDAFAANTYTISGVGAYTWYTDPSQGRGYTALGQSWKTFFSKYGKNVVFTEYGDVDNPKDIPTLTSEFGKLAGDGTVNSSLFFNALNTNPDWARFALSGDQLNSIVRGAKAKAGINSAEPVTGGRFPDQVTSTGLKWELEIVNGPGDFNAARDSVNAAIRDRIQPVLRICTGNSCGFGPDANNLVTFLRQLNAVIDGPVWVVAGPNEPNTELWATPQCMSQKTDFFSKDYRCNQVTEPGRNEYHSLRPYPASPCDPNPSELALLCGNDLVIRANFEKTPDPGFCTSTGGDTYQCTVVVPTSIHASLNFNQAELPIAGNTELVPNGYSNSNALSSKTRTNEYVSWYLNGVMSPAEEETRTSYADSKDNPTSPANIDKTVNYSGPLRKLLPERVQWDASLKNIADAVSAVVRHNQVVGCSALNIIPGLVGDFPLKCYFNNYVVFTVHRMADWVGSLPPKEEDFPSLADYEVELGNWLGRNCTSVTIPLTNQKVWVCSNLTKSSFTYGLYSYIPMSSTEDRVGTVASSNALPAQNDVELLHYNSNFVNNQNGEKLFFAHMQENSELATLLQGTYSAKGTDTMAVASSPDAPFTIPNFCEVVKSRSNAGDKLWARSGLKDANSYGSDYDTATPSNEGIAADISFEARYSCIVTRNPDGSFPVCKKSAWVADYRVQTGEPKGDELWNRLVDGQMSIFKRIYPKVGDKSPVKEIADLPASTFANYDAQTTSSNVTVNPLAGDPDLERSGSQAQIYLAHLGGVYDYFLKGIQKALRPKGYSTDETKNLIGSNPGSCKLGNPPYCDVAFLLPYFGNDQLKASQASQICNGESGGNPNAKNLACLNGGTRDYSIGLFQINMLAWCSDAFSDTGSPCKIKDEALLKGCVLKYLDPVANIKKAVEISNGGTNWGPWGAARACGIVQ